MLTALLLVVGALPGGAAPGSAAEPVEPAAAPEAAPPSIARTDRILVTWDRPVGAAGAGSAARLTALSRAAGRGIELVRMADERTGVYRLSARLEDRAPAILRAVAGVLGVAAVEPDAWLTQADLPDDPRAGQLWGLHGIEAASPWGIDALAAWPVTRGAGIVVAVLDTGLVAHEDLAGQAVPGYDMISDAAVANDGNGRDPDASDPGDWVTGAEASTDKFQGCSVQDSSWHGTHVAGTIAALAGNGKGVFGGAPDVKVQPVRVLGKCGGYASDIADGIRWAAGGTVAGLPPNPTPARVLNLSLGGSGSCSTALSSAIADARGRGAVVVTAAGNSDTNVSGFTPANCPGSFVVAATGADGKRASFSNYGSLVAVAGPGVGIWSTVDAGTKSPAGSAYAAASGTSMAAPHVSLTAALVTAAHPEGTPVQVEYAISTTTTAFAPDSSTSGCQARGCGTGVVHAGRAVDAVLPPAVASFAAVTGSLTSAATVGYTLTFTDPVTGLEAGDFTRTGTATGCVVGDVAGEGTAWTVTVRGCSEGTLLLRLGAGTVANASLVTGPPAPVTAATVRIDRTAPAVTSPVLAPSIAITGSTVGVTATATDATSVAAAQVRTGSGAWTTMQAADGVFGGPSETLTRAVTAPTVPGRYDVCARATDGAGNTSPGTSCTKLAVMQRATVVAAGANHSCALLADGSVRCWGANTYGQLGDGTTTASPTPVTVLASAAGPPLTGVTAIVAGNGHTCARLSDGTVRCWGAGSYGQLGNGGTASRPLPVAVRNVTAATSLASGANHTCARLSGGSAVCWGRNQHGQLGDGTKTDRSTPRTVRNLTSVRQLAAGGSFTCALRTSAGEVRCWGLGSSGQLGNGSTSTRLTPVLVSPLTGVTVVTAGTSHACARLSSGSARCWGANAYGQLGDGTTTRRLRPVKVASLTGVASIAAGAAHTCAPLSAGGMRCWGRNHAGQLGDGTTTTRLRSVKVAGLAGSVRASGGAGHTIARSADGTVRTWGANTAGQLGDGSTAGRTKARQIAVL